jgi:sugar phosphate isomerase/epimerase
MPLDKRPRSPTATRGGDTIRHCYQIATPEIARASDVTALQGDLDDNFALLSNIGYQGVELMTIEPRELNWSEIRTLSKKYHLPVVLVCTGEVYGQLGLSFTDCKGTVRTKAIEKVKAIVEFASYLGANINIGRVRGLSDDSRPDHSLELALAALHEVCAHASPLGVKVLIEHIERMETNFITTVAEACHLVDILDLNNFGIMMDVFAMYHEESDLCATIRKYSPQYNYHVHLSDSDRHYPGHKDIDFDRVIRAFCEAGFNGAYVEEVLQLPNQEAAARRSFDHVQPILAKYYST